ncbi:transmembrane protein 209 [Drosophila erecta]|uniref:Uncharacterized protein n=1 Tax=Drosophila erecta TaxID=7220 RepID=B3NBU2_DROER|nr:transmembrane protein 209 [Drosophila erecta]EDV50759.2 uncharacterized protein Dere_GG15122 [Drosophila erecta]
MSILFLDISFNRKYWYYVVECFVLALIALSALLYFGKYLWLIFGEDQVIGTESQKRLLDGRDDTAFGTVYARPAPISQINVEDDNECHIPYWHSSFYGYIQNSRVVEPAIPIKLLQCVTNLRYWISTTILHRLVTEVQHVDKVSQKLGLINLKIGETSLKTLRLWAEHKQLVETCLPMLPTVLAFLNFSDNQNYLVQRIKELAKGVYMAEYRWKFFQEPHERLPTDAAIVFHLFCVYMDCQLMPTAQEGGRRPFYSRYVVIGDNNPIEDMVSRVNNRANCAILATGNHEPDPKFNFFSGKEVQDCLYDRNNLFYVIIQFLTYMREQQGSILEGVSLGRSGINILDVIDDIPHIPRCDKF